MTQAAENPTPWYREPYVWLVLAPLIAAVIGGLSTLFIAIDSGGHADLPGDYESAGKLVQLDPKKAARSSRVAKAIAGRLETDTGVLIIRPTGALPLPTTLQAMLVHPTLPDHDVAVTLQRQGEAFRGILPADYPRRGELHLYPADHAWRVVAPFTDGEPLKFHEAGR